jgi:hypothetical protein
VRPIVCDYSNGPRFVLSKQDEVAAADLLLTREENRLSDADVALFNRFFAAAAA